MILRSRLTLLMFWMLEKGVHIGDPIRRICFSFAIFCSALRLLDGMLKTHGLPNSTPCLGECQGAETSERRQFP